MRPCFAWDHIKITMAKEDGVRTVVVGGKDDIPQQYCGTVGGQSTDFRYGRYRNQGMFRFNHTDIKVT